MTGVTDKTSQQDAPQPAATETTTTETKVPTDRPRHSLLSLRDEIDRLVDDFSASMTRGPFRSRLLDFEPFRRLETAISGAVPTTDVIEKDNEFVLALELPGIEQKDVDVDISGNLLTIKGEKREEKEEKTKQYHLSERRYGSFSRSFTLPETVDPDKIAAAMKDGVLTITLPKTEAATRQARKIEIAGK